MTASTRCEIEKRDVFFENFHAEGVAERCQLEHDGGEAALDEAANMRRRGQPLPTIEATVVSSCAQNLHAQDDRLFSLFVIAHLNSLLTHATMRRQRVGFTSNVSPSTMMAGNGPFSPRSSETQSQRPPND